jgi:hypothetical protein
MANYQATESAVIDAPAAVVYAIIRDYHAQHPAILPVRYFTHCRVIEGGHGAGTVIDVAMNVYGTKTRYRMVVTEPEPGRVLQEEDADAGVRTTFTVDPLGATQARVTIATTARASDGINGRLERMMTPAITRRIYREKLAQLAKLAEEAFTTAA